jgi:hypothetical protein
MLVDYPETTVGDDVNVRREVLRGNGPVGKVMDLLFLPNGITVKEAGMVHASCQVVHLSLLCLSTFEICFSGF